MLHYNALLSLPPLLLGTATEVYDYMRLLWSRVGRTHCPACERHIVPDTVSSSVDRVLELPTGTRIQVAFPLPRSGESTHELVVSNLRALGFVRLLVDGDAIDLSDPEADAPAQLGRDVTAIPYRDIEVVRGPAGPPFLRLHGRAAATCAELGVGTIHLSLSHERSHAVATVILED